MTFVFFLFAFLLSTINYHAAAIDFCVADLKGGRTPAGYPCKLPKDVTVEDFVFSKFVAGTPNQFNFSTTSVVVDNFPALNGLGFSIARADLQEGAVVPFHSHPDATETLSEGDVFVIPKGLLHFGINSGKGATSGVGVFTSENPSIEILDLALFGNNLDSAIVEKTTFLDAAQVKKLKGFFKGSG
ncbi:unnamed protein product [Lupinus luteus]|uniref:Germin-like protein n=1 Tax=Lupinus luteus TaxID=3873 RepID=A0AAV1WUH7_LUPLU